jgi:hypothetical protein
VNQNGDFIWWLEVCNYSDLNPVSFVKQFFLPEAGSLEPHPELLVETLVIRIALDSLSFVVVNLHFISSFSGNLHWSFRFKGEYRKGKWYLAGLFKLFQFCLEEFILFLEAVSCLSSELGVVGDLQHLYPLFIIFQVDFIELPGLGLQCLPITLQLASLLFSDVALKAVFTLSFSFELILQEFVFLHKIFYLLLITFVGREFVGL